MEENNKRYNITGMSCAVCAARVEKAVSGVESVSSCSVNLLTNELTVNSDAIEKDIITAVKNAGYGVRLDSDKESLKKTADYSLIRLIISVFLLLAVLVSGRLNLKWLQIVLTLLSMVVNRRFFISGIKGLLHKAPNMDTLVSIGSLAAFIYGYYDTSVMILTFISIGKLLEEKSKGRTTDAIASLKKIVPKSEVKKGDIFEIKAGSSIEADGIVLEGHASVNESMLTGESIPVEKTPGDKVSAGTICTSGFLKCEATAVGEDTALSSIIRLVSEASSTKAPIAKTADKVASVFVPTILILAALTTIIWLILGKDISDAISYGIAVLVISCPCAMGLATPVSIMVSSGVGARNGILFKTAAAIEKCGKIDIVVLDKTGTITKGRPAVTDVIPEKGTSKEKLIRVASVLEKKSEHPIGLAISEAFPTEEDAEDFETLAGTGVKATIDGLTAFGGRGESEELSNQGKTPAAFTLGDEKLGIIAVADEIKDDAKKSVQLMKQLGLDVVMLTGDNNATADAIAKKTGIDKVISQVLPDEKEKAICDIQKENRKTAMVGDGINDAPSLVRADVGIAIGSGTDVALDSADIILMKSDMMDVYAAVKLSRKTLKIIKENLFWAFIYNIICIPVAAGVFSKYGVTLNPAIGAACMSCSSLFVVSNALRINLIDIYNKKDEKMVTKTIKVDGMMCPHCEARVKKALEEIAGVEIATASHEQKLVTVVCSDSVSDEMLKNTIVSAGYEVL